MSESQKLVKQLAQKVHLLPGFSFTEIERSCWIVVHEYVHGFRPYEYDIREIDEDLYAAVLKEVKLMDS